MFGDWSNTHIYSDILFYTLFLLGINTTLWIFSLILKKTWPVDFIWSSWPILHLGLLIYYDHDSNPSNTPELSEILSFALVSVWGIRLTSNFAISRSGIGHEDWRYAQMRQDFGKHFWWISLFSVFLGQTLFMFMGCLSLFNIVRNHEISFYTNTLFGGIIIVSAICIEAISDLQLNDFIKLRQLKRTEKTVFDQGLWSYSRHPNYFGELSFWIGLWVMGGASIHSLSGLGPVFMTALFVGISIGLMETRQLARKQDEWVTYTQRVPSSLIPIPLWLAKILLGATD